MKITICGSIAFFPEMLETKRKLEEIGHEVKLPPTEVPDENGQMIPVAKFYELRKTVTDESSWIWQRKAEAMHNHFDKVGWADAILVLNYEKNEQIRPIEIPRKYIDYVNEVIEGMEVGRLDGKYKSIKKLAIHCMHFHCYFFILNPNHPKTFTSIRVFGCPSPRCVMTKGIRIAKNELIYPINLTPAVNMLVTIENGGYLVRRQNIPKSISIS